MKLCDKCGCEPEPMETDKGEIIYFFIISKGDTDPSTIMSFENGDLEYVFRCSSSNNPELKEGEKAICGKCMEELNDN